MPEIENIEEDLTAKHVVVKPMKRMRRRFYPILAQVLFAAKITLHDGTSHLVEFAPVSKINKQFKKLQFKRHDDRI